MKRWDRLRNIVIALFIIVPGIAAVLYFQRHEALLKAKRYASFQEWQYPENVVIGNREPLQKIKLFPTKEGYTAFLPAGMENDARFYFSACQSISIEGNGNYKNGDRIRSISDGVAYKTQFIGWDNNVKAETKLTFYHAEGIPTVYILTDGGTTTPIDFNQDNKIDAHFLTADVKGNRDFEGKCTIKTRGISSWWAMQKSYNIKTDTYITPFGMDSAREWALLANYGGSTQQLQNKITFDLAQRIGIEYTPDSDFCNVYIDGEYRGLYLLAERATIDGGSVKLDDMTAEHRKNGDKSENQAPVITELSDGTKKSQKVSAVSADDITGAYLLEKCVRYAKDDNYFWTYTSPAFNEKNPSGLSDADYDYISTFVIKNPSSLSDAEFDYISAFVGEAMDTLYRPDSTTEELQNYFDFDSWLRVALLEDFACEWDMEYDSFKFYKKRGVDKLFAGPLWDFDLAYGFTSEASFPDLAKRTGWIRDDKQFTMLNALYQNELFRNRLKELYNELLSPAVTDYMDTEFFRIAQANESAFAMSKLRWGETYDYQKDIKNLYTWISDRRAFLDEWVNQPESFHKVTFELQYSDFTYYVKDGEALNFLPASTYGDDVERDGIAIKWINREGLKVDAAQAVTGEMTLTPIADCSRIETTSPFMRTIYNRLRISKGHTITLDLSGVTLPFGIYAEYRQDGNSVTARVPLEAADCNYPYLYSCRLDLPKWNPESSKLSIYFSDTPDGSDFEVMEISGNPKLMQSRTDLRDYLKALHDCPNSYSIMIAAYDDAGTGITQEIVEGMWELGLRETLAEKIRYGYAALLDNGRALEKLGNDRQLLEAVLPDSTPVRIVSTGFNAGSEASVLIGGNEYAIASRGLNFVVYDNNQHKVIDSVVFDTYLPPINQILAKDVQATVQESFCVSLSVENAGKYRIVRAELEDSAGHKAVSADTVTSGDRMLFTGSMAEYLTGQITVSLIDAYGNRYSNVQTIN